jgi:unsaturated chondroitin disaccharide hydrolase
MTSGRGSWTGGFWAGLWWLRAAVLGGDEAAVARGWTSRLIPRGGDDTATRGMTFWYGAGSGHRLTGDPLAAQVAALGRAALAASFDTEHRLVPFGRAFDPPDQPARAPRAVIDPLAGIIALLTDPTTADPETRSLARRHAGRHLELCLAPDGAVRPEVALPGGPATRHGWARGQAWGLLGFAVAARDLDTGFTEPARRAATWWLDRVPPGRTSHAVLGDPTSPEDTSAAAIAAAALLTLGGLGGPGAAEHRAVATGTVAHLVERHLRADGVLGGGCYDHTRGLAPAHELVWGTYFLAATLAVLSGRVADCPW